MSRTPAFHTSLRRFINSPSGNFKPSKKNNRIIPISPAILKTSFPPQKKPTVTPMAIKARILGKNTWKEQLFDDQTEYGDDS